MNGRNENMTYYIKYSRLANDPNSNNAGSNSSTFQDGIENLVVRSSNINE
jgi:hypothetical protein